jgi:hypothetical protein
VRRHPLKQRVAAWLAIVAMILHGSWPLIADGKPKAFDLPLELCSAHGVGATLDKTQPSAPVAPPAETGSLEHCPFCGANVCEWVAVQSGEHAFPLHAATAQGLLLPFVAARGESVLYLAARPRGPPPVS